MGDGRRVGDGCCSGATVALLISTNRWLYLHAQRAHGHRCVSDGRRRRNVGGCQTWHLGVATPAAIAFGALPPGATRSRGDWSGPTPAGFWVGRGDPDRIAIGHNGSVARNRISVPAAVDGDLGVFGPVYGNLFVAAGIVVLLAVASVAAGSVESRYRAVGDAGRTRRLCRVGCCIRPRTLEDTLPATGSNLAVSGLWGLYWWVVPLFIVGALLVIRFRLQSMWTMSIFGYTLALLAFVYLREGPYRVGNGDSGSRMMVHAVFVAIVYVVLAGLSAASRDDGRRSPGSDAAGGTPEVGADWLREALHELELAVIVHRGEVGAGPTVCRRDRSEPPATPRRSDRGCR